MATQSDPLTVRTQWRLAVVDAKRAAIEADRLRARERKLRLRGASAHRITHADGLSIGKARSLELRRNAA